MNIHFFICISFFTVPKSCPGSIWPSFTHPHFRAGRYRWRKAVSCRLLLFILITLSLLPPWSRAECPRAYQARLLPLDKAVLCSDHNPIKTKHHGNSAGRYLSTVTKQPIHHSVITSCICQSPQHSCIMYGSLPSWMYCGQVLIGSILNHFWSLLPHWIGYWGIGTQVLSNHQVTLVVNECTVVFFYFLFLLIFSIVFQCMNGGQLPYVSLGKKCLFSIAIGIASII